MTVNGIKIEFIAVEIYNDVLHEFFCDFKSLLEVFILDYIFTERDKFLLLHNDH